MVTAGQTDDLPQQVREDGVWGLSSKHRVLHQHKERPDIILGMQSDQHNSMFHEKSQLNSLKQLLTSTLRRSPFLYFQLVRESKQVAASKLHVTTVNFILYIFLATVLCSQRTAYSLIVYWQHTKHLIQKLLHKKKEPKTYMFGHKI